MKFWKRFTKTFLINSSLLCFYNIFVFQVYKTLFVSLAGVLIIAGSFFVSGEMVNRMIIIAFGVIVTISGTSSIIGKSK